MQVIRTALGRLLTTANLEGIRNVLVRLCYTAPLPIDPGVIPAPALDPEPDATAERFTAWETERRQRLGQAERWERRGLRLLARAALLRAAVCCEDQGAGRAAEELRALAVGAGQGSTADSCQRLTLRLVAADESPANRPA